MKVCERHRTILLGALAEKGCRQGLDPVFQCESLIAHNVAAQAPELITAPQGVCPLCQLPPALQYKWIDECTKSIAAERRRIIQ